MPIQGNPTAPLVAGARVKDPILSNYVFQAGIHKPEHSGLLAIKYPQYYLTAMLDRMGRSEPMAQVVYSWNTQDRTRANTTLTGGTLDGTVTSTTVITSQTIALAYWIVGDIFRSISGVMFEVNAVGDNGTYQTLTISKVEGGVIAAADLTAAQAVGHIANWFEEGSSAPLGRLYLPDEDYNYLQIFRRSFKITGDEFTNKTYLGDAGASPWYFKQEELEMMEFRRDQEGGLMFGVRAVKTAANGKKKYMTNGIFTKVDDDGVSNTFATATGVSEDDIMDHTTELVKEGGSNEYTVLCGAEIYRDIMKALRPYHLAGGVSYGSFGNQTIGLDVQSYDFFGKLIHFKHYELFNDLKMLPFASTATATKYNFGQVSLWLDLGSDSSGEPLIQLTHKENNGVSRKFIHTHVNGMMGPDGTQQGAVANGDDAFQINYLAQIGTKIKFTNRMGILAANS